MCPCKIVVKPRPLTSTGAQGTMGKVSSNKAPRKIVVKPRPLASTHAQGSIRETPSNTTKQSTRKAKKEVNPPKTKTPKTIIKKPSRPTKPETERTQRASPWRAALYGTRKFQSIEERNVD